MPIIEDIIRTSMQMVGAEQWSTLVNRMARASGALTSEITAQETATLTLGVTTGTAAIAMGLGIRAMVDRASELEQVRFGFTTIFHSAEAAQQKIEEIQKFARTTPFDFPESVQAARRLAAVGVETGKILPLMRGFGDAVAAAGGNTEKFEGALAAAARIEARGRLFSRDLIALANYGIPVYSVLREQLGLTADQMANIGKQGLDSNRVLEALRAGFEKRFGGAMERQSDTLAGSLSNLRDVMFQLGAAAGGPALRPLTLATRAAVFLINAFTQIPGAAATLGIGLIAAAGYMTYYTIRTLAALAATIQLQRQILQLGATTVPGGGFMARLLGLGGNILGASIFGAGTSAGSRASFATLGMLGAIGGTALQYGAGMVDENRTLGGGRGAAAEIMRVLGYGLQGAALGSLFGFPGMAIGGIGGLIGGGIYEAYQSGAFGGKKEEGKAPTEDPQLAQLRAMNASLQAQLAELKEIKEKGIGIAGGGPGIRDALATGRVYRAIGRAL